MLGLRSNGLRLASYIQSRGLIPNLFVFKQYSSYTFDKRNRDSRDDKNDSGNPSFSETDFKPASEYRYQGKKHSFEDRNVLQALKTMDQESNENNSRTAQRNLAQFMDYFSQSKFVKDRCKFYKIPSDIIDSGIKQFSADLLADNSKYLSRKKAIDCIMRNEKMDSILLPPLFSYFLHKYPKQTLHLKELYEAADFTRPEKEFFSRRIKRKVTLHIGPTNSGKTYQALKAFKEAKRSIYLSPLRLLAHEIYEKMNSEGIPCNMVTGEERKETMGVNKIAATVEMAPLGDDIIDVAVIDEIQMLNDPQRGWAWTNAFLGIAAMEIHLCGEPAVLPLIKRLCNDMGDDLTVVNYERLSPVKIAPTSLDGNLMKLRKGDCLVSFSRKSIYSLKEIVERRCGLKAAVIYGSLPPEARSEQARLFNDPNSGYDILIASDAIGMGINLHISRVVFERISKFDGVSLSPLSISQIKQIGGRAGRYGLTSSAGLVTALDPLSYRFVKAAFFSKHVEAHKAGLLPSLTQIEAFSRILPKATLSQLIYAINDMSRIGDKYFMCQLQNLAYLADALEGLPMNMEDKYTLVTSPCPKDPIVVQALIDFAKKKVYGGTINLRDYAPQVDDLLSLEKSHRILVLYMWLSLRFPEDFNQSVIANVIKVDIENKINKLLLKFSKTVRKSI